MRLLLLVGLVACGPDSDDVVGPFTGEVRRFAVDRILIPTDGAQTLSLGADLDGDDVVDNQFGNVTGVLASTNDLSTHSSEMLTSGAIASYIEIQADDLWNDDSVGVRYYGAEGDPAVVVGGRLVDGLFVSNRTRDTTHPGQARLRVPVYVNADPLELDAYGLEIEFTSGGDFPEGYVRGGFREEDAREAAYVGLIQMFETEPERHLVFARTIDKDRDAVITREEVFDSVIALLVKADIDLFDGERVAARVSTMPDSLSFGFGIHFCAPAACGTGPIGETCRNRVKDAYETDVDCGGLCQPCAAAKGCNVANDCQSQACDAGSCRAATCSDGVRDGYESDVDCGGACAPCVAGKVCAADSDCASTNCSNGIASLGTCS